MEKTQPTNEELRKEIYSLRRELRENIKGVREIAKNQPHFPRTSLHHMTKLEKRMREKAVKYMDAGELRTLYRDLKYVKDLKSSSVKGVTEMSFALEPIKDELQVFSKDKQKQFWDIYGRIYQIYNESKHFKYEIIPMAYEYFKQGYNEPDLMERFEIMLRNATRDTGGRFANEETFKLRFTEGLRDIFKVK